MYELKTQDGVKVETVATCFESDLCYEWHDGAVLRTEDGRLFWVSGSGCSCNSLDEDIYTSTLTDFTPVSSLQEAVDLAKQEFSDSEVAAFAEQLFGPGR